MAWQNSFTIKADLNQQNLIPTDTTGQGTPANPTGYNYNGNPTVAQVDIATMVVYVPDATTYQLSDSFVTINLITYGFPTASTVFIPMTALGIAANTSAPDGVYQATITETSTEAGVTTSYTVNFILTGNAECCVSKLTSTLAPCGCSDKNSKQESIFKANLYISAAQYNTCDINKAANMVASASEICAQAGCGGGCGGC